MTLRKFRKILKENSLRSYKILPREKKIVLEFDNGHTLLIQVEQQPFGYSWRDDLVVKMDEELIATTLV